MDTNIKDVWHVGGEDRPVPGPQHLFAFLMLILVGTVVGTLGTIGLPVGHNVSAFWPAITLQVAGGMWFGAWGVLGGVVFSLFANLLTGGSVANVWGFIPANVIQCGLTVWVFRRWRLAPWLPTWREVVAFIVAGVFLSNLLGATTGIISLAWAGEVENFNEARKLFLSWVVGNGLPCLVLGPPLLRFFSPLIVNSPFFCDGWFGSSRPFRWAWSRLEDWPLAARLLLGFGIAGVLPILIVSVFDTMFQPLRGGDELGTVLPVMLNLTIFLSLIVSGRISKTIDQRLRILAEGAQHLGKGELSYRLPAEGNSELAQLSRTFNQMAIDLKKYTHELAETTAAKERIESELKIAYDIQMGILPKIFPPFPDRTEFDIYATLEPAREVGGDFYDFFFMDDTHLCFAMGDASGKGVPAALFMAVTKTLIKSTATEGLTPEKVLSRVNRDLSQDNPSLMFVTLFLGILNIQTGEVQFSNGGHNPPYLLRADGDTKPLEFTNGMALGVVEDFSYESKKILLQGGDTVFLYTDGVTEAMNSDADFFTDERLEQTLEQLKGKDTTNMIHHIRSKVDSFSEGTPQSDDITMLALRFNG
jgi:serine phosphatase RsbU (regulator of sigma subunit)/integral membrane sensor domain MASE1